MRRSSFSLCWLLVFGASSAWGQAAPAVGNPFAQPFLPNPQVLQSQVLELQRQIVAGQRELKVQSQKAVDQAAKAPEKAEAMRELAEARKLLADAQAPALAQLEKSLEYLDALERAKETRAALQAGELVAGDAGVSKLLSAPNELKRKALEASPGAADAKRLVEEKEKAVAQEAARIKNAATVDPACLATQAKLMQLFVELRTKQLELAQAQLAFAPPRAAAPNRIGDRDDRDDRDRRDEDRDRDRFRGPANNVRPEPRAMPRPEPQREERKFERGPRVQPQEPDRRKTFN